jgi:RND superfamily putative drug exporter
MTVDVGGSTASGIDFSHVLAGKLPLFIGIVVALAALLLMILFRSLLIPLQGAAMNLLSIGASLGVVQAIPERGWLDGLLGIQPGPIGAFYPVILFAIVFGLSMDYEIFLVSRIHEHWQHHHDSSAAIRDGVTSTGRVITAAGAVMVLVFASFAVNPRSTSSSSASHSPPPSSSTRFSSGWSSSPPYCNSSDARTWTLPSWLDHRLPHVAIEPHTDTDTTQVAAPIPILDAAT